MNVLKRKPHLSKAQITRFNVDVKYLDCAFKDGLKILSEEDGVKVIMMVPVAQIPMAKI